MHAYYHHIGDYRKDTAHLSLMEHGIYRQLLDTYYLDQKPLCLDHAKLMRSHSVRSADEVQAFENVLQDFFERTENGYVHKRCEAEIGKYKAKSESASKSAKARWGRESSERSADEMRTHSEGNANHKPVTSNHKPVEKQKSLRAPRFDAQAHLESMGVEPKVASDWLRLRKGKRLAPTETAFSGVKDEAVKAGISMDDAVRMCCVRGWGGFDAAWVQQARASPSQGWSDKNAETIAALTGRNRQHDQDERTIDV